MDYDTDARLRTGDVPMQRGIGGIVFCRYMRRCNIQPQLLNDMGLARGRNNCHGCRRRHIRPQKRHRRRVGLQRRLGGLRPHRAANRSLKAVYVGLLALGAALSPVAKKTLDKALSKVGSSSLTLPFVIITWLAIMILGTSPANSMDASLAATGTGGFSTAILKGLSEVFLADSAITGFIFIAALAADSRRSAVLALFGSAIGIVAATIAGASPEAIGNGLYGFSPALTAIAVGSRFDKLGIAPAVYTLLACGATVIIQILIEIAGIPPLTAPFCIATLLSARK